MSIVSFLHQLGDLNHCLLLGRFGVVQQFLLIEHSTKGLRDR